MYETKLDNLQLDEKDKIGYVYKCMGSGFWALKQNDFRTALQQLVMEVGKQIHSIPSERNSTLGSGTVLTPKMESITPRCKKLLAGVVSSNLGPR